MSIDLTQLPVTADEENKQLSKLWERGYEWGKLSAGRCMKDNLRVLAYQYMCEQDAAGRSVLEGFLHVVEDRL